MFFASVERGDSDSGVGTRARCQGQRMLARGLEKRGPARIAGCHYQDGSNCWTSQHSEATRVCIAAGGDAMLEGRETDIVCGQ